MRLQITTTDGQEFEYVVDDRSVSLLEFQVVGQDPELPARHWLSEIASMTVSEHPAPASQTPAAPRLKEVEVDVTPRGYLHDGSGGSARIGPKRSFRTMAVDHPPEPVKAKPRPRAKR